MLYHVGDSQHTENIQINKVIGENKKEVFYFMGEKPIQTFGQAIFFRDTPSQVFLTPAEPEGWSESIALGNPQPVGRWAACSPGTEAGRTTEQVPIQGHGED